MSESKSLNEKVNIIDNLNEQRVLKYIIYKKLSYIIRITSLRVININFVIKDKKLVYNIILKNFYRNSFEMVSIIKRFLVSFKQEGYNCNINYKHEGKAFEGFKGCKLLITVKNILKCKKDIQPNNILLTYKIKFALTYPSFFKTLDDEDYSWRDYCEDIESFKWLEKYFINPENYKNMHLDFLVYFAGLGEVCLYNIIALYCHERYDIKNLFDGSKYFVFKDKFKIENINFTENWRYNTDKSECLEYINIESVFGSANIYNNVINLIEEKKLDIAKKVVKKMDTYILMKKKDEIEEKLSARYNLDYTKKEEIEPSGVPEDVIDFSEAYQTKILIRKEKDYEYKEKYSTIYNFVKYRKNKLEQK